MPGDATPQARFITFEGGEGAGKSTQIKAIAQWLRAIGHDVIVTREPGGTPLGEALRRVLMAEYDQPMPVMSELLLMFAARAAHLAQVIEPSLTRGAWVLCDRFTDASFAYQGAARRIGDGAVALLEQLVQGERRPDRVMLLDLPVDVGLARTLSRAETNRFDQETLAFHESVRRAYRERAAANPSRYCVIDATADAESVLKSLQTGLENLI